MPVPIDDVDAIAASVAGIYRQAETNLTALIGRHLARGIDGPRWATDKLTGTVALRRDAEAVVATMTTAGGDAMRTAAAAAFRSGSAAAVAELAPHTANPRTGPQTATTALPQWGAIEALAASVHRDVGERSANVLRNVDDVFRSVVATATAADTLTGAGTRRTASAAAFVALNERGVANFQDVSGRTWKLSSYVEMAARTVTQRAAVAGQLDRLADLGVDLVYVSDASQECKLCRPFEGKILRRNPGPTGRLLVPSSVATGDVDVDVFATLAQARTAGLFHPNCRHTVSAYLPGASRPPAGQLADPEGDTARQRQRALERAIRKAKTEEAATTELDPTRARDAATRRRLAETKLTTHIADSNTAGIRLKRLKYREKITHPSTLGRAPLDDTALLPAAPRVPPTPTAPAPPRGTAEHLATLDDTELGDLAADAIGDDDLDLFDRISAEEDRRAAALATAAAARAADTTQRATRADRDRARREKKARDKEQRQSDHFDQLVRDGIDDESAVERAYGIPVMTQRRSAALAQLRQDGHRGRSFDDASSAGWVAEVERQYILAEDAVRGTMLSKAARQRGADGGFRLWYMPAAQARANASEELRLWWDNNPRGRITLREYRAELLGDLRGASDSRAARGDFLT